MAPKTIILKNKANTIRVEAQAAAAITPGHFVEYTSAGKVQVHGNAGQNMAPMVAVENDLIGDEIGTAYAADDNVLFHICPPGTVVYSFLATGNNVAIGDLLESDGAGGWQAHTPQAVDEGGAATYTIYLNAARAIALEALNNASGSQSRLKVLIV